MLPGASGFGLAIHLKIHIFKNACLARQWTFLSELGALSCFRFCCVVYLFELRFRKQRLVDEPFFEKLDWIVFPLIFFDFLLRPISRSAIFVGYGMTVVAVSIQLENHRLGFSMGALDRCVDDGANFVNIFAVRLFPFDAESLTALGET